MGERVVGTVNIRGEKASVKVMVAGSATKQCVARLMLELTRLARRCGLKVKRLRVHRKSRKKGRKKGRKK